MVERYFPTMIWVLETGEEYKSLMEPVLYSRLISPMVRRGMYR